MLSSGHGAKGKERTSKESGKDMALIVAGMNRGSMCVSKAKLEQLGGNNEASGLKRGKLFIGRASALWTIKPLLLQI